VGDSVLLSDLLLARLQTGLAVDKADGRARLLDRARPLLGNVPGGVFWDLMVSELATLCHLPEERVRRHLTTSGTRPTSSPRHELASVSRTPVRYAIALLLYKPGLAAGIENPQSLASIPEPGVKLLAEILEIVRESPHINLAGILERYRDTEHEAALRRLSQWRPEIADERLVTELRDTIDRLRQRNAPRRQLLEKLARGETLSETEIETLRRLGSNAPASGPDS
jgi:DNA primase